MPITTGSEGRALGPLISEVRLNLSSERFGMSTGLPFFAIGDTRTLPTPAMLAAVQTCTLQDDLVQEDRTTLELEAHIAKLTGKEAALFILSGIMGNQLGLRTNLTQPPHAVLCDHRSHIMHWEAGR